VVMTVREAYREAVRRLKEAGVENAAFYASLIFEKHTGIGRRRVPLEGEKSLGALPGLWEDIARRAAREPLQYILGQWEFMGQNFRVGKGVLIPRPETELLAQTAIDFLCKIKSPRLLDLCAGTGCVAVAAAKALPELVAVCVEKSGEAFFYLNENIALHGLSDRVKAVRADMLEGDGSFDGRFDAVVCNPPYVRSGDLGSLQSEVRFEPREALDGGEDGLEFYRAFVKWQGLLRSGGLAAFEVGEGQAGDAAALLERAGIRDIFTVEDFSGIERVVAGFRR
jgi:release factor glutamine methyltransferase